MTPETREYWRATAVAGLVYSIAFVIYFGDRVIFGGHLPRPVQAVLVLAGTIALVVTVVLGAVALRRSRQ